MPLSSHLNQRSSLLDSLCPSVSNIQTQRCGGWRRTKGWGQQRSPSVSTSSGLRSTGFSPSDRPPEP